MYACMDCGRKFKTTRSAERACDNGCPKCGSTSVDLDTRIERKRLEPFMEMVREYVPVRVIDTNFAPLPANLPAVHHATKGTTR